MDYASTSEDPRPCVEGKVDDGTNWGTGGQDELRPCRPDEIRRRRRDLQRIRRRQINGSGGGIWGRFGASVVWF
jgi:hypothetical protein